MKFIEKNGLRVYFRPGTADEEVLRHSFDKDIFYKAIPEYKPQNGDTIIDIGAHIGTFSLLTATINPNGIVYAIEPCEDSYSVLDKSLAENQLSHINAFKLALSGKKGKAKLYYDIITGNWGHSLTHQFSDEGEIVITDTLDNFFEHQQIQKCDFIKFNCEGSEFEILMESSSETLEKIDKMLVLYHMDLSGQYHINKVIKKLNQLGFYCEKRFVSKKGQRGWLVVLKANKLQRVNLKIRYLIKWPYLVAKSVVKRILK